MVSDKKGPDCGHAAYDDPSSVTHWTLRAAVDDLNEVLAMVAVALDEFGARISSPVDVLLLS